MSDIVQCIEDAKTRAMNNAGWGPGIADSVYRLWWAKQELEKRGMRGLERWFFVTKVRRRNRPVRCKSHRAKIAAKRRRRALRLMSQGMRAGITSPARKWFSLNGVEESR